ncbi:hypothetical protein ACIPUD_38005 [Bradyrhizobium sp. CAR08]
MTRHLSSGDGGRAPTAYCAGGTGGGTIDKKSVDYADEIRHRTAAVARNHAGKDDDLGDQQSKPFGVEVEGRLKAVADDESRARRSAQGQHALNGEKFVRHLHDCISSKQSNSHGKASSVRFEGNDSTIDGEANNCSLDIQAQSPSRFHDSQRDHDDACGARQPSRRSKLSQFFREGKRSSTHERTAEKVHYDRPGLGQSGQSGPTASMSVGLLK